MSAATAGSCLVPLGSGTAAPGDPFWLETIKHQGIAPYSGNSSYQVFRNVKDFGAIGDGVTDDTVAINLAISQGGRCGGGTCTSSTVTPAVIYFPAGTYLVSNSIIPYDHTNLVGDARNPPTLLAAPSFNDIAVIDVNPYTATGQWYVNQNTFFRSIRNFVIDVRQVPFDKSQGTGIHWQVAQATSLVNIRVEMSTEEGTAHQGLFIENGSGGFMGDLVFNGGQYGMWVGNQQFTVRNVTVNNAQTAVYGVWNWGWTFLGIKINNCQIGFDILTATSVAAETILDTVVNDTPIFLQFSEASDGVLSSSFVLKNIKLNNVPVAIGVADGTVILNGTSGSTVIDSWTQGNVYSGDNSVGTFTEGPTSSISLPDSLLDRYGNLVGRGHPQYETYSVSQFVSVRDHGAKGDGVTDDTAAIQTVLNLYAGCKIIFFDAGAYIITSTLTIPANSRIVGEAWSIIAGSGPAFQDINNPQVVVRVGEPGSQGVAEITDIVFTTVGPAPGAIVIEWNIHESSPASAGMWDSHIRLGGAAGTNLQVTQCPQSVTDTSACMAAFLALHLTSGSTAYLEGTWIWLADHDLEADNGPLVTIFAGRGVLSESQGPVWLIGTASEHFALYQYNIVNANNHFIGFAQTETPYFQPLPPSIVPYPVDPAFHDPPFSADMTSAWAFAVSSSNGIYMFGSGFYSFYQSYTQDCLTTSNCQTQIVNIDTSSTVYIFSLSTVASEYQLSINQQGVINQSDNVNGFPSTVSIWTQ